MCSHWKVRNRYFPGLMEKQMEIPGLLWSVGLHLRVDNWAARYNMLNQILSSFKKTISALPQDEEWVFNSDPANPGTIFKGDHKALRFPKESARYHSRMKRK